MIDAISQLLESPVAYHAVLAKALRSVPAAVMLSQGIYWQRQAEKAGRDTFWMTIEGWYEQTGITPESQNTARRVLRNAGFWHEMLVGMPAKTHYRIDVPALVTVITGYLETRQQVTVDYRNKPRVMPRTSHGKFRQHSTVVYRKHETPETSFETSFESSAREKIRENSADVEAKPLPQNVGGAAARRANSSDEAENLIREWANGEGRATVKNWIAETTFSEKVHGKVRDEITKFVGHYAVSDKPGVSHKMFSDPVTFFKNRFKAWLVQAKELNRPAANGKPALEYQPSKYLSQP